MAGPDPAGELNHVCDNLRFSFATADDDADLRALFGSTPMRGAVRLGFAHEPSYFAGTGLLGARDRVLIARDNGRLVAAGRCVVQPRWVDDAIRRCGYLGELRLSPGAAGRWDILRRGYAFYAENAGEDRADLYFTSVLADNTRARRLFERGWRGLPRYTPVADFTTLVLRTNWCDADPPAGVELLSGDKIPARDLIRILNDCARMRQLAVAWPDDTFNRTAQHGLGPGDFLVARRRGLLVGCVALWDQRPFRQVIVHGYNPWLTLARPIANCCGTLTGWPALPRPGSVLAHACLSPFAVDPAQAPIAPALVRAALAEAKRRGLDAVALGADTRDPLWSALGGFRSRRLASVIYTVQWPEMAAVTPTLARRPCSPDLALL